MKKRASLVYSTEAGRICPSCGTPSAACCCRQKKAAGKGPAQTDGIVQIRREVKGRKGKTVTVISGLPLGEKELGQLANTLKRRCGSGGTVRDGLIMIQGDHRETLLRELQREKYRARIAGG
jgi:translation initiation factor 1